jgi:hypothetical protein
VATRLLLSWRHVTGLARQSVTTRPENGTGSPFDRPRVGRRIPQRPMTRARCSIFAPERISAPGPCIRPSARRRSQPGDG